MPFVHFTGGKSFLGILPWPGIVAHLRIYADKQEENPAFIRFICSHPRSLLAFPKVADRLCLSFTLLPLDSHVLSNYATFVVQSVKGIFGDLVK